MSKLEVIECELCQEKDKSTLHKHHIIPRTDPNCTDHPYNLCVVCSNCHNKIHAGLITIIGIYPSTKLPYGRTVIYEKNGKNKTNIKEPYCVPKPKQIRWGNANKDNSKKNR